MMPGHMHLQPIIGRDADLDLIAQLLHQTRLLTITGPGGVGKTTLAQHSALRLAQHFPAGVIWVDLSDLRDPALLLLTVAQALEVATSRADELRSTLIAYLQPRTCLLVLDNCEQLLDAAPVIADLLAAAPHVRLLCTSRAAWRLSGEQEYPLAPLELPDDASLEAISAAPAVQLLLQRAQAQRSNVTLTTQHAASLMAICARLDGLPLAIELAAARLRVLSPADLLARLEHRLPLLTGGARDAPDRQRTLLQTIAWSYDLLTPEAQRAFRRLAVFRGGLTISAVAAV